MPLEIEYRPVIVPPAAAAPAAVVPEAPGIDPTGMREAVLRNQARLHHVHRRRARLRWRIALVAVLGMLPALLVAIGWGDPHGIRNALAQTRAMPQSVPQNVPVSNSGLLAPTAAMAAWNRTMSDVHADGDSTPVPSMSAGPAARPTLLTGSGLDRARALQCLTAAIYYEAAREPDAGQRAVAQVVLNRVAHPAFPKTVCGVVYQGSEHAGCQFSFACDGSMLHAPVVAYWTRARRVAEIALAGNVFAPVGLATHYHTSAVHPGWSDTMQFIGMIGAHRFYRWTGSAGQPRAFSAVYAGGEPVAAPHPRTWVSTGADFADPIVLEKAFEAGRLAALRAAPAAPATDPAIIRAGATFGQQPLGQSAGPAAEPARSRLIPGSGPGSGPESGKVRPDAEQQYDAAARWIRQPGS
jgi:hypothetical protein